MQSKYGFFKCILIQVSFSCVTKISDIKKKGLGHGTLIKLVIYFCYPNGSFYCTILYRFSQSIFLTIHKKDIVPHSWFGTFNFWCVKFKNSLYYIISKVILKYSEKNKWNPGSFTRSTLRAIRMRQWSRAVCV